MILVRSGGKIPTGYKHCYPRQRFFAVPYRTVQCTFSLIYSIWSECIQLWSSCQGLIVLRLRLRRRDPPQYKLSLSMECSCYVPLSSSRCAGIFKQSMGARNRVGIELSYRSARLHRLPELIFGLLKCLKILVLVSNTIGLFHAREACMGLAYYWYFAGWYRGPETLMGEREANGRSLLPFGLLSRKVLAFCTGRTLSTKF